MNFFQYNPQSQILQAVNIPLTEALSDIECLVQHRVEEARRYKSIIKHEFKLARVRFDKNECSIKVLL